MMKRASFFAKSGFDCRAAWSVDSLCKVGETTVSNLK